MRKNERGVALILVLVILPLVAIIMTQLSFETAIGDRLASNVLANQQFKLAILARLRQMRLRLVRDLVQDEEGATEEGGAFDHYGDLWGPDSEGGGTAPMVKKGDADVGDEITLYTEVIDEQSKFNVNLLLHKDLARSQRAAEVLRNLLNFFRDNRFEDLPAATNYDLDDAEAKAVTDAILKFMKGNERDERVRKADLPDPAPDMSQGVYTIRDLVFAHPLFIEKRLLERFTDVESGQIVPSLAEFITVYGDGKVNVNTAPIQVLRAFFKEEKGQRDVAEAIFHDRGGFLDTPEDQEEREKRDEERTEAEEDGREDEIDQQAYRTLNDLGRVEGMGDGAFLRGNDVDVGRDFAVRSQFFTVIVTARRDNFLRQHRLVLERHAKGCITWATEVRAADLGDLPAAAGSEVAPGE